MSRAKAVEDYRSPRRFAMSEAREVRQVLECASPLALCSASTALPNPEFQRSSTAMTDPGVFDGRIGGR